jgi:hypothetical protein
MKNRTSQAYQRALAVNHGWTPIETDEEPDFTGISKGFSSEPRMDADRHG